MNVLVLGGTGSIGTAIVRCLVDRGHVVTALVRSAIAEQRVIHLGAEPMRGDIRAPESWVGAIADTIDAVVHTAATFTNDMAAVDHHLLNYLIARLQNRDRMPALIYTGGCWLYGDTGGRPVHETAQLNPPAEWTWMAQHLRRIVTTPRIRGIGVLPAMVWSNDGGGVLRRFIEDAKRLGIVRVVGGEAIHWPLVHADDLAVLYASTIECGRHGAIYNGASIPQITVGAIARGVARRFKCSNETPHVRNIEDFVAENGAWARGYVLDQGMSSEWATRELGWKPRFLDVFAGI
jgi:nucleoside-diphosphate-sugar epimerase